MKKHLFWTGCLLALATGLASAELNTLWTQTYGGSANDGARDVIPTSDGGFLAVGYTNSFGDFGPDVYLVKTDVGGQVTWSRTYGGAGRDYGYAVCETSDGNFVFTGFTKSFGTGDMDVYLVKVDTDGNEIWSHTYGGAAEDEARGICEASDGSLIITGRTQIAGTHDCNLYLIRTDAAGDSIWTRSFGGAEWDWGWSVCELADGDYGVVGTTGSVSGNRDAYLLKVDPTGTAAWAAGLGSHHALDCDRGFSIIPLDDGGMVVAGFGNEHDTNEAAQVLLFRVAANGNVLLETEYGEGLYYDYGLSVCRAHDGGYLIVGITKDEAHQNDDLYLIKVDSGGRKEWTQIIGGHGADRAWKICEVSRGRYIIGGHTSSEGAGGFDFLLLHMIDPSAQTVDTPVARATARLQRPQAPLRPGGSIHFSLTRSAHVQLEMVNCLGRVVDTLLDGDRDAGEHAVTWTAEGRESGVYYCVLTVDGNSARRKVVLLR